MNDMSPESDRSPERSPERDRSSENRRSPGRDRPPERDAAGPGECPVEGVEPLDHTADLGIRVEADDLPTLFRRAAAGVLWLALGRLPETGSAGRSLRIEAADPGELLRRWLQEILYLQEVEDFTVQDVPSLQFAETAEGMELEAELAGGVPPPDPSREIKGVTRHGLEAEERDGRWLAEVIFDV